MPHTEGQLISRDGLRLRTQTWKPEGAPRAGLVLMHGQGEHSGRYGHVGEALSGGGYAVYAYDLRGHGRSDGPRGHIPNYDALLDDLELVLAQTRQENPGKQVFLYGHSLGGQIVLNYILRRKPSNLAGVVLTSPWLRLAYQPAAWKVRLAFLLAKIWPTFTQASELDQTALSRDTAFLKSMPDQALYHSRISARMGFDELNAAAYALVHAAEFALPFLLLCGAADRIVDPASMRSFYDRAASADKTFECYPEGYHEVHNDIGRATVLRTIVAWLDRHIV